MPRHVKVLLLASAYAPALAIWGLLQSDARLMVVMLATSGLLVVATDVVLKRTDHQAVYDGSSVDEWKLTRVQTRESELAAFLLGYLIPFVQWRLDAAPLAWLALVALIAIVLFLNWHLGVLHLNPTVMVLGWRIVDMTETDSSGSVRRPATVLCRGRVPVAEETLPNVDWQVARVKPSSTNAAALWLAKAKSSR
jgi:hypothetical protein